MSFDTQQTLTDSDGQEPLIGLPALMKMAFSGVDLAPLGARLLARADTHPNDANTLMDLSIILQLRGNREVGLALQAEALKLQPLYRLPAAGGQAKIRLLAIMGPGDLMENTPLEFLLEGSDVTLDMLYAALGQPFPASLPEHDLVFVAIGESDKNHALLQHVEKLLAGWPRPVLNLPSRIDRLSRDGVCSLLDGAPGIVLPVTLRFDRQTLKRIASAELPLAQFLPDGGFPVIVRPIDSHAGQGLAKIDDAAAIAEYLQASTEDAFYLARFVDYRGQDGLFRKYRIVLIDGHPFVCHMAVSAHWMVHYLNADMLESANNRAEEARFMANFDKDFAPRHAAAFHVLTERTGLDYFGVDCGETADGRLLIFEVDSNMIVHAMDSVEVFPYKHPQMYKVFSSFREMLANKMGLP